MAKIICSLDEQNLSVNKVEYEIAMKAQKDRSKQAGKVKKGDWTVVIEDEVEEFVGYNNLETEVKITRYREVRSDRDIIG